MGFTIWKALGFGIIWLEFVLLGVVMAASVMKRNYIVGGTIVAMFVLVLSIPVLAVIDMTR